MSRAPEVETIGERPREKERKLIDEAVLLEHYFCAVSVFHGENAA